MSGEGGGGRARAMCGTVLSVRQGCLTPFSVPQTLSSAGGGRRPYRGPYIRTGYTSGVYICSRGGDFAKFSGNFLRVVREDVSADGCWAFD